MKKANPNLCGTCSGKGIENTGNFAPNGMEEIWYCSDCKETGIKPEVLDGIRSGELAVVPREPTKEYIDWWMDNESVGEPYKKNPQCRQVVADDYRDMITAAEGKE